MRLNEIEFGAQPPIDGYGPGGFRIAGVWYEGSIIVIGTGVHELPALTVEGIEPLLDQAVEIDVVLIGQGTEIALLDRDVRRAIEDAGPGAEIMSTPSACRTYNVLLAEDRRVAAILVAV